MCLKSGRSAGRSVFDAEQSLGGGDDVRGLRRGGRLERLRVRHRHVSERDTDGRGVEIVERLAYTRNRMANADECSLTKTNANTYNIAISIVIHGLWRRLENDHKHEHANESEREREHERTLHDARADLGANTTLRPAVVDGDESVRLLNTLDDRALVHRT